MNSWLSRFFENVEPFVLVLGAQLNVWEKITANHVAMCQWVHNCKAKNKWVHSQRFRETGSSPKFSLELSEAPLQNVAWNCSACGSYAYSADASPKATPAPKSPGWIWIETLQSPVIFIKAQNLYRQLVFMLVQFSIDMEQIANSYSTPQIWSRTRAELQAAAQNKPPHGWTNQAMAPALAFPLHTREVAYKTNKMIYGPFGSLWALWTHKH